MAMDSGAPRRPIPWFLASRWRLLLTLTVALLVPLAVLAAVLTGTARSTLEDVARERNRVAANLAARAVNAHFDGLMRYVEAYARDHRLVELVEARDTLAVRAELESLVSHPALDRSFITDEAGVEWFDHPHVPEVIGVDFSFRDWFRGVSSGDTYVSEIYRRAAPPRRALVAIACPMRDRRGQVVGYLVAQHTVHQLSEWIERVRPGEQGAVALVDHHGRLAAPIPPDHDEEVRDLSDLHYVRDALGARPGSLRGADPLSRMPSLMSHAPVPAIGWAVIAHQPEAVVMAPVVTLQTSIIIVSSVCFVAMLLLSFLWLNVVRRQHEAVLDLQESKDMLAGMIVHDIRSPLSAIRANLALVREDMQDEDEELRRDLELAQDAADRVLSMANDLLDVARMEEGRMPVHWAAQDLGQLVHRKVEQYEGAARAQGLEIRARLSGGQWSARVDPDLLGRVVDNLLVNAIKHTPAGGEVRLELHGSSEEIRLSVHDTGEGIPAEALPRLFQKYARVESEEPGSGHGTGLGLLFCRMAVELHGGKIGVDSEVGRGSIFRVDLPVARV